MSGRYKDTDAVFEGVRVASGVNGDRSMDPGGSCARDRVLLDTGGMRMRSEVKVVVLRGRRKE